MYEIVHLTLYEDIRRNKVTLIFGTPICRNCFKDLFLLERKDFLILQPESDSDFRIFFFVS